MLVEHNKYPFLIEPPLSYIYLIIIVGLLILINKVVYEQKKFKYFLKDFIGYNSS